EGAGFGVALLDGGSALLKFFEAEAHGGEVAGELLEPVEGGGGEEVGGQQVGELVFDVGEGGRAYDLLHYGGEGVVWLEDVGYECGDVVASLKQVSGSLVFHREVCGLSARDGVCCKEGAVGDEGEEVFAEFDGFDGAAGGFFAEGVMVEDHLAEVGD